jgi:hypothetical protein
VSAYALTNDYAAEEAHLVRRCSRLFQEVPGRSFFGQRRGAVPAGTAVEVSLGPCSAPCSTRAPRQMAMSGSPLVLVVRPSFPFG